MVNIWWINERRYLWSVDGDRWVINCGSSTAGDSRHLEEFPGRGLWSERHRVIGVFWARVGKKGIQEKRATYTAHGKGQDRDSPERALLASRSMHVCTTLSWASVPWGQS
jgi:hypothetical protein